MAWTMARVRVSAAAAPGPDEAGGDGAPGGVFLEGREGDVAGAQGENRVAVEQGVGGVDGPRQAVLGHLGKLRGLGLGQFQIGGHHADRGVANGLGGLGCRDWAGAGAGQGPEFVTDAQIGSEQFTRHGVDDTAEGIDGDESADDDALAQIDTGGPQAALEAARDGARARADVTQGEDAGRQVLAGLAAKLRRGPVPEVPAKAARVEKDRRRYDGNDLAVAQGPTQPPSLQPAHDPIRRGQTKGAAAGEDDGVYPDPPD
jgi:hypothetical protein